MNDPIVERVLRQRENVRPEVVDTYYPKVKAAVEAAQKKSPEYVEESGLSKINSDRLAITKAIKGDDSDHLLPLTNIISHIRRLKSIEKKYHDAYSVMRDLPYQNDDDGILVERIMNYKNQMLSRLDDIDQAVASGEREIQALRNENSNLNNSIEALEGDLAMATEDRDNWEDKYSDLADHCQSLQNEIEMTKAAEILKENAHQAAIRRMHSVEEELIRLNEEKLRNLIDETTKDMIHKDTTS